MMSATARACSNIAFIKYWGNTDHTLKLPANASLSMNLEGIYTETRVSWDPELSSDGLMLNGEMASGYALERVSAHLDLIRERIGLSDKAQVISSNNFPTGAGIASSASAFAALTLAATTAAGLSLTERELSTLARIGSGSASRSIPAGFVEWHKADTHEGSFSESIAGTEHWNLVDVIAIVSTAHKAVGSREGHPSADTSDLQPARVANARLRLDVCKQALFERNFRTFAEVVEHDSNLMHAVMMTSRPPLFYWLPATLAIMAQVRQWRADGLAVCYTLDAGPNVHCLCLKQDVEQVRSGLLEMQGVEEVRLAGPGGAAEILQRDQNASS